LRQKLLKAQKGLKSGLNQHNFFIDSSTKF
jgi:hypothetical protein